MNFNSHISHAFASSTRDGIVEGRLVAVEVCTVFASHSLRATTIWFFK
jgi:hypothetical protein